MNNILYYGDNLDILRRKLRDETVDLCYIDPPFNSKRNYFQIYNNIGKDDQAQAQAFMDTWTWNELAIAGFQEIITNVEGRYTKQTIELLKGLKAVLGDGGLLAYLVSMTQRVNEIQRVLKPTGSFYLHCDPTASHYLKLVLDSVFCARGGDYLNEIVWKRTSAHNDPNRYGNVQDIIFFYVKTKNYIWNPQYTPYSQEYIDAEWRKLPSGRFYKAENMLDPQAKMTEFNFMGTVARWRTNYEGMMELWNAEQTEVPNSHGRIKLGKNGKPIKRCRIIFLDEMKGVPLQTWWGDIMSLRGGSTERLGYPTQKPEALLERIIQASSNEGDTVLDAYCGCGTTVAVAQRLRRHWMGIDITYQSIAVILKRLEDSFGAAVMDSIVLDGIPRDMESARALANKKDDRVRKEFEKWALLTYSKNRATINEKKGADRGVDGIAYIVTGNDATERVIFQVKSGTVKRNDIATLHGDMTREGAVMAIFLTLEEPTKPMCDEALAAGIYHHELLNHDYPKIQIVTIREMIEDGKRIDLPLNLAVLKTAATAKTEEQHTLTLD